MSKSENQLPCEDFGQFMEMLRARRKIDDGIIYELNTIIPTQSFSHKTDVSDQCKTLYNKLKDVHSSRVGEISHCVAIAKSKITLLKAERDKDPESYKTLKALKNEQTTLRLFQQELNVEDIVWERDSKAFNERCRNYYSP